MKDVIITYTKQHIERGSVMKKILALLLSILILLGMCACGSDAGSQKEKEPKKDYTATEADITLLNTLYGDRKAFHGDLHNHSNSGGRSDGKVELRLWPTLVMDPKQMDFAVIADHKQSSHMRLPEWDATRYIGGTEAATTILDDHLEQGGMHYNIIFNDPDVLDNFLKSNYEYKFGPDAQNEGQNTFIYAKFSSSRFREVVAQIYEMGGFFTNVHPNYDSYLKSDDPLDYWYGDYTGYEVMTGTSHGYNLSHDKNLAAYNTWVQMLNLDKIVFATFGSDNHRYSDVAAFSTIYADEKLNENFLSYVRKGDFTAGPVGIRMAMGDVTTGGQTDFAGKRLVICVDNFHTQAIKKDHQYRLDVYNENGLVFSQEFDSAEKAYFALDAQDCKYYRADVYDVTEDYIFAVGNPIWNKK